MYTAYLPATAFDKYMHCVYTVLPISDDQLLIADGLKQGNAGYNNLAVQLLYLSAAVLKC